MVWPKCVLGSDFIQVTEPIRWKLSSSSPRGENAMHILTWLGHHSRKPSRAGPWNTSGKRHPARVLSQETWVVWPRSEDRFNPARRNLWPEPKTYSSEEKTGEFCKWSIYHFRKTRKWYWRISEDIISRSSQRIRTISIYERSSITDSEISGNLPRISREAVYQSPI